MELPSSDRLKFFLSRTEKLPSGCLIWLGKKKKGYAWIHYRQREYLGHRLIWQGFNGRIPSTTMVCHSCDNPACINPEHLFLGDAKANVTDMVLKGRAFWQIKRDGVIGGYASKTTDRQYEWMFLSKEMGMTNGQIGAVLGRSAKWVREVLNGKVFKHWHKETKV